jgi:hypothetical protein
MCKPETIVMTKTNVTHKPLNENTICFNQIVDQLSNYTLPIFNNFLQGNFHLFKKLTLSKNHHQKPSNTNQQLQKIITFDPFNEIRCSLVCWKALAKALFSTPLTPNLATQLERKITKPPRFNYSQNRHKFPLIC